MENQFFKHVTLEVTKTRVLRKILKYHLLLFFIILATSQVCAQNKEIKGVVLDESGEPLIGASVILEGTSTGVITDLDGKFIINSDSKSKELQVSYVGYETKKVSISTQFMRIVMKNDAQMLDDVVVIGYGTAKKTDLTGAVESMKAEKLNKGNVSNALQLLQGQVTGLYINSHNQDPGSTNSVLLRGIGSLAGNSEPLIVIDGFPVSDISILNTISTDNIEQIDVLKDASATAIYGSRGANGVIIVSTKSGTVGKMSIDYNTKLSIETVGRTVEMMNSDEYIRFYYDWANDPNFEFSYPVGYENNFYPYPLEAVGTTQNTNWQKELTSNTPLTHEHNLTLSGGTNNLKYRLAGNYYDGSSIVGPYNYKRFNINSKINYKKNKFAFNVDFAYSKENTNQNKNSYINAVRFAPTVGKYDEETGELSKFPVSSMSWYQHPFLNENDTDNFTEINTTRINGSIIYDILPFLKIEGRAGIERRFYEKYYYQEARTAKDQGSIDHSNNLNVNLDLLLNYKQKIGKNSIEATGGTNYQTFRNRGNYMFGEGFSSSMIKYYQMNNVLEKINREISSFWNEKELSSYFLRTNYSYDDRYLFTFNFRMDGATQFSENNKWGYFPSIAFAWKINNEKFFHSDFFNNLKLKIGYGLAGNANIPSGRSLSLIQYTPVFTGGVTENGISWDQGYYPNPNLKWEGTKTFNLGLEIGSRYFWIDLNAYSKKSFDLLIDRSKPVESGYSKVTLNKGEVVNYGAEAKINGFFRFLNNNLRWNPSISISYNYNKITDMDNDIVWNMEIWGEGQKGFQGYAGCNREGYPVGSIWGYEYLGVWQEDEIVDAAIYGAKPGEPKFLDRATSDSEGNVISYEPDGKIDDADRKYLGSQAPSFMSTFSNTISYKDWSLSFMFDGVFDKTAVNYNRFALIDPEPIKYSNLSKEALKRWTPDFTNTDIPSLTSPLDSKLAISSFCIEDASFVRLRELTLAYQHNFISDYFIKKIRLSLTATNLVTFTGYHGLNPDIWGVDNNWNLKPLTRSFVFAMGLSF